MNEERNKKEFHSQIIPFPKIILSKRNGIMPSGINFNIGLSYTSPRYKTESIDAAYSGCNELIAIFVKSIDTASKGGSGAIH